MPRYRYNTVIFSSFSFILFFLALLAIYARLTSVEQRAGLLLAGRLGWKGWPLHINGTVGAISISYDEYDFTVFDVDVYGALDLFLVVQLVAGYHAFEIDGTYQGGTSNVVVDARLSGPYVGVRVSF